MRPRGPSRCDGTTAVGRRGRTVDVAATAGGSQNEPSGRLQDAHGPPGGDADAGRRRTRRRRFDGRRRPDRGGGGWNGRRGAAGSRAGRGGVDVPRGRHRAHRPRRRRPAGARRRRHPVPRAPVVPVQQPPAGASAAGDPGAGGADERRDGRSPGRGAADGGLRRRELHRRLVDRAAHSAAARQPHGDGDPLRRPRGGGRQLLPRRRATRRPSAGCRRTSSPTCWSSRRSASGGARWARWGPRSRRCTTTSAGCCAP